MARIEAALYAELTTDATVASLVSTRIYPEVAPQDGSRPFVVYQRISTQRGYSLAGPTLRSRPRFQLTSVADTFDAARAVAHACRAALNGFSGSMGSLVAVGEVQLDNEFTSYDPTTGTWITRQDFVIWHTEGAT